ncbi:cupin domain-containing protein [Chitinolyticbacter albus]|uniref:cupin domain-containing protein n=1 Tax=Chitinolyticbacter albus TaxID=2961951 RepID=UPI00210CDFB7|nr:cupin domain-containing protein [Chitinolyticbacter albus]
MSRFDDASVELRAVGSFVAPWHRHAGDELLLLLTGDYAIETEVGIQPLAPGNLLVVPGGMRHRGRSEHGARLLALLNRGDA